MAAPLRASRRDVLHEALKSIFCILLGDCTSKEDALRRPSMKDSLTSECRDFVESCLEDSPPVSPEAGAVLDRVCDAATSRWLSGKPVFEMGSGEWPSVVLETVVHMEEWESPDCETKSPPGGELTKDVVADVARDLLAMCYEDGSTVAAYKMATVWACENKALWLWRASYGADGVVSEAAVSEALFELGECFRDGTGGVAANAAVAKRCFVDYFEYDDCADSDEEGGTDCAAGESGQVCDPCECPMAAFSGLPPGTVATDRVPRPTE